MVCIQAPLCSTLTKWQALAEWVATCSHYFVRVQPSKRAFPTHAQRSLVEITVHWELAFWVCGLVPAITSLATFPPSSPSVSMFIQMDAPCSLETGSVNRMPDQVADDFSFADGWCSLPPCCSPSCKYQQTFLPAEQQAIHLISSRISCAILEPQLGSEMEFVGTVVRLSRWSSSCRLTWLNKNPEFLLSAWEARWMLQCCLLSFSSRSS